MAREARTGKHNAVAPSPHGMLREVKRVVGSSWADIVGALAAKARGGDLQCAKLLLELMREAQDLGAEEKKQKKRSLATEWANEPEWTGEQSGVGEPY